MSLLDVHNSSVENSPASMPISDISPAKGENVGGPSVSADRRPSTCGNAAGSRRAPLLPPSSGVLWPIVPCVIQVSAA